MKKEGILGVDSLGRELWAGMNKRYRLHFELKDEN